MKDFFSKLKTKLPFIKETFFKSLSVILIYQGLLFLISPTVINQILLVVLIIVFVIQQMSSSKSLS